MYRKWGEALFKSGNNIIAFQASSYAHALRKKVVLTARKGTKIHFDISNFPVIWYNSMSELERKLKVMFENILTDK